LCLIRIGVDHMTFFRGRHSEVWDVQPALLLLGAGRQIEERAWECRGSQARRHDARAVRPKLRRGTVTRFWNQDEVETFSACG
jgi:hypothetical protein